MPRLDLLASGSGPSWLDPTRDAAHRLSLAMLLCGAIYVFFTIIYLGPFGAYLNAVSRTTGVVMSVVSLGLGWWVRRWTSSQRRLEAVAIGKAVTQARQLGSYELVERIGQGGMGEVWKAKHHLLARPAAVKLVRTDGLAPDSGPRRYLLERFEREAQATASLESPHTVALYDFGVAEGGVLYYAMELVRGVDLEAMVRRFGPLPAGRVVHLLSQACESLADAHAAGLVHRDIKPANLLVGRRARQLDFLRVLDFGLVKRPDAQTDVRLTSEGTLHGTPAYLAPESVTGEHPVGPPADLYALGCVAYWLLTGALPFDAEDPLQMAVAHATRTPIRPGARTEVPIPSDLERLVLACLATASSTPRRPSSCTCCKFGWSRPRRA